MAEAVAIVSELAAKKWGKETSVAWTSHGELLKANSPLF